MARRKPLPVSPIPEAFLRLSEAVDILEAKMFGGIKRPGPINEAKKYGGKNLSVGWGPWRERAKKTIRQAALRGEIKIYAVGPPPRGIGSDRNDKPADAGDGEPMEIPVIILECLPTSRGGFLEGGIRLGHDVLQKEEMSAALETALYEGSLVVDSATFQSWYETEKARKRWPSQRGAKHRIGRPSIRTEAFKNAVQAIINDGEWNAATHSVNALRRRLQQRNTTPPPSADTLIRLVDGLFEETGDPALRRPPRKSKHVN